MPFGEEGGMTPHRSVLSMMVRGHEHAGGGTAAERCAFSKENTYLRIPRDYEPDETEGQSAPPASMRLRTPFPEAPPPGIFSR